jgi:hypothetical protein
MIGIRINDHRDIVSFLLNLPKHVLRGCIRCLAVAAAQEPKLARLEGLNHRPWLIVEAEALREGGTVGLDLIGAELQEHPV